MVIFFHLVRWVDRRRTDPRKLRQVVRILGLEVRLNGHEI